MSTQLLKKNILMLGIVFCLVFSSCLVLANELKVYPCYRMEAEPVLDGKDDDLVWSTIPSMTGFVNISTAEYCEKQTYFKIGYTEDYLFFFVRGEEPHMEKITARLGHMENLWTEDSVEIFLQHEDLTYYQFIINTIGSRWNGRYYHGKNQETKLADWQVAIDKGENYWSLEAKIPFAYLRGKPVGEWRGNIGRNIRTTQELTTWAPMKGSFHDPSRFGRIIFQNTSLTTAQAQEVERELIQAVYGSIDDEIMGYVKELSNYKRFFEESKSQNVSEMVSKIDALINETGNTNVTFKERISLLEESKALYSEAGELRSRILLEMIFQ